MLELWHSQVLYGRVDRQIGGQTDRGTHGQTTQKHNASSRLKSGRRHKKSDITELPKIGLC